MDAIFGNLRMMSNFSVELVSLLFKTMRVVILPKLMVAMLLDAKFKVVDEDHLFD